MTAAASVVKTLSRGPTTPPSFEETYEQYFDFVWRSLRRLGIPPASLDDATQDVFLVVHRRLREFEGRSSLKTWLFGIAWNVAQKSIRSSKRPAPPSSVDEATDVDTPQDHVAKREAVRLLHAVLDRLQFEQRAVFVMAEFEELTAPEIAELTGVPVNTVYSRLRAAHRNFDVWLQRLRATSRWRQQ